MAMDYDTKSSLISQLTDQFNAGTSELTIDTSNYITSTGTLDCSALGLDVDTLQKTNRVIDQQISKFSKEQNNKLNAQYILHLKVAKKCVEEIIHQKAKN